LEKLPTLIKENNLIKGAIISALSGVVATKEDIKELIREMDKRFEEMREEKIYPYYWIIRRIC